MMPTTTSRGRVESTAYTPPLAQGLPPFATLFALVNSPPRIAPLQPPPTSLQPSIKTPPAAPPMSGGAGGGAAALLRGLGAWIGYSIPDWWNRITNSSTTTIQGNPPNCDPQKVASDYLKNLKLDGIDQTLKAIPPQTFEWAAPNGYKVSVKQGWGKYGLAYTVTVKDAYGKAVNMGPSIEVPKAQINSNGITVPVGKVPLVMAGENFGTLSLDLRVNNKGLDEAVFKLTGHSGVVTTLKLKPSKPCGLDLTQSQLLRVNAGNSADARYWGELHLAQSAQKNGGSLKEGLKDLLMVIEPSASGNYRNHGSDALAVLSKPLNALKNAGVDMRPLEKLQQSAAEMSRNTPEYRRARNDASKWLTDALSQAFKEGKISPLDLSNPYHINFGLAAVANAQGPLPRTQGAGAGSKNSPTRTQDDLAIKANWRDLQQGAASNGYGLTQFPNGRLFAVPVLHAQANQAGFLEQLASTLKVKKEQLVVRSESHILNGVMVKGIVIEPRVYEN
jgi:hypothetical protein